ncbi:YegS/Rv2252/BmrU family lipid kinase [Psychrosphaera aquimarina]|uniref:YegS/Rv2252/BmrU family lipid kinase n=1 Tax=Psychrosphaera aquimarina TaxID=2044854 RepID=A0ABU3QY55_9GAMM|nr:YegS/Rv2252/BmrU family lipid kinase [Psychrosphaera aquimarina]MDU0112366.1 YegS/Rv2252/BmrU family lipid kinase [Psychrosphaera aquimarina]
MDNNNSPKLSTENQITKYLIVFNPLPNKKRQTIIDLVKHRLIQKNMAFDLYPTDALLRVNQCYFETNIHQYTDVIVIGGDGTLHCVVNSLPIGTDINVGLIPAGTGNDFARMWYGRKNKNIPYILDVVTANTVQTISLGKCVFNEKYEHNQYQHQRLFHNVMGTGFDSQLSKALRHNKGTFKGLSYLLAAVKNVPFYRERASSFVIDGIHQKYENLITAFANGQYFGGGLKVAPKANPLSNQLDIVQVGKHPLLVKLKLISLLCVGKHLTAQQVTYTTTDKVSVIDSVGLDLQADGEYIGQSPCEISVIDNALRMKR